ncbi:MAG: TrbI/VirB10 family protein, partial [Ensifer adhaerens]
ARHNPNDPRGSISMPAPEAGIMPMVARPHTGPSALVFGIGAVVAGVLLFAVLDARRSAPSAPAVKARAMDGIGAVPPPLYVPPEPAPPVAVVEPASAPPSAAPPQPQIIYVPQPYSTPATIPAEPTPQPLRAAADPALVLDTSALQKAAPAQAAAEGGDPASAAATMLPGSRARAGMFANRATTVPQGTLIPAVLETAFDSTRPGFARAIVSRDVRGFDGTRVLIPRGSRLIGEYRSDAAQGQGRALVNWFRLIRPDGVTMAISSPAGDPLGRGGIRARVDSHFFERFTGAILQSALDIGVNLASRAGKGTVIVLPGTIQQSGADKIAQPSQVTPTLTVRQGTSISIFVARDLDFTGVESRR